MFCFFFFFLLPSDCVYIGWNGKRWWRHKDVTCCTVFSTLVNTIKIYPILYATRHAKHIYLHTQPNPKHCQICYAFLSCCYQIFKRFFFSALHWDLDTKNLCQIHNWFAISFICNINFKQQSRGGSKKKMENV